MASDIFLLDTNIISNSSKQKPHPRIAAWLSRQARLAIPYAALLEIETGIFEASRSHPDKALCLWRWMDELLDTDFEYPLPTPEVARLHAKMLCCRPLKNLWLVDPKAKDKKPGQDLFIAATAIVYDMPIATLDGDDFLAIDNYFALPGVYNPAFDLFTVLPEIDRASSACVVA